MRHSEAMVTDVIQQAWDVILAQRLRFLKPSTRCLNLLRRRCFSEVRPAKITSRTRGRTGHAWRNHVQQSGAIEDRVQRMSRPDAPTFTDAAVIPERFKFRMNRLINHRLSVLDSLRIVHRERPARTSWVVPRGMMPLRPPCTCSRMSAWLVVLTMSWRSRCLHQPGVE